MGDTEENATQEIDEKCTNLHITSPPAMGPDNPPGGMDTAKKSQKNDPSSQEYKKAKAMARSVRKFGFGTDTALMIGLRLRLRLALALRLGLRLGLRLELA